MRTYARRNGLGKVLCAPCGVRLPGQAIPVEPDILFVRRERLAIIECGYVEGAPDLVVEILSPSNANYDLKTKYALYEQAGVAEYGAVIPWDRLIRIYRLVDSAYQLAGEYSSGQVARSEILTGFTIAVDELFQLEMEKTDVQEP